MTRSNSVATRLLMIALLPLVAGARSAGNAGALDLQPESRLWVGGTSSLRGWECRASTFTVSVESSPNAAATVIAGEKSVASVDLVVPIDQLECGNGTMNGHMRKALKAQEHPQIAFRMTGYELTTSNDSLVATISGALTIGGAEKPVELVALATAAPEGALRVAGTYQLKMTEFGLKPPSLMFGRMKVGDLVKVGFDVVLKDRTE